MKGLIVFLLLLACALCAVAQTQLPASHPAASTASRVVTTPAPAATTSAKADLGLFASGSAALAAFLFIWTPFAATWRRRLGSRAELSALILALLLCGILAVEGCSTSAPASSARATPPAPPAFSVLASA